MTADWRSEMCVTPQRQAEVSIVARGIFGLRLRAQHQLVDDGFVRRALHPRQHLVELRRPQAWAGRQLVAEQDLGAFPYVVSSPLGVSYQVSKLPYAVILDHEGVLRARGIINSREHLESLFEAKRLGVASMQDYLEGHRHSTAV